LKSGTVIGHYEIIEQIGAGGMGEVYLARDKKLDRKVAVKILNSQFSRHESNLNRFVQEAKAASALNHPNILIIHEIGETDETLYIVSEFIKGKTLREIMTKSSLELPEILDIAVQTAGALAAAHEAFLVHRDIKPENIMIRPDGYVKVLDFGLAKLVQPEQPLGELENEPAKSNETAQGIILGTVQYMSPEQAKGEAVDLQTDIFSFGTVIYEMLTGKTPFQADSVSETFANLLKSEPPPLARFASDVPDELQRIVSKMLRKDKSRRYKTMNNLLSDLRNLREELTFEGKFGKLYDHATNKRTEKLVREPQISVRSENFSQKEELNRLAILPFRNLTRDSSVSFYEFSLADAVITELVRLRSLFVCPSSVVAKYLGEDRDPFEIGRELNVTAVLSANFLHTKERMRVTTQLLDVVNRKVIWGERIDSESGDIIAMQDTIAQRIVDGLHLKFSSSEEIELAEPVTDNSAAYEEYLRGRDLMRRYIYQTIANEDIEKAVEHFKRAIELDANFALAHCALGSSYLQRVFKGLGSSEDIADAQEALDKGLALDSKIIEAKAYRLYISLLQGEKRKAHEQIAALRREAPHNSLVHFFSGVLFRQVGDYENALRSFEEMLRVDPTARILVYCNRARIFIYRQLYQDALAELEKASALEPHHPIVKLLYAYTVFSTGDPARAAGLFQDLINHYPGEGFRPFLAMCLSAAGEHAAARAQLTENVKKAAAADSDISYWLASAYLMENFKDEALKWLEHAINLGDENRPFFETNPVWKSMRNDSRFKELMSRIPNRIN
jgi:eukaryotic-like serine/threonine-protein kinase